MTTVTESDIKEIKELIVNLEKNLTAKIADVEKNLTAKITDSEKKIIEVAGEVKTCNAKIEALDKKFGESLNSLDKRVSNQEFINRAVFIGIISLLLTPVVTNAIRYFWEHPLF